MTRAYVHRNGQFPVLADFHSRIELYWTLSVGVNREIVDDALEVEFGAEEFPGVAFHEPVPDWRRYRTLTIDVENPAAEPLKLVRARARPPPQPHVQRSLQPQFRRWPRRSAARCESRSKTSATRLEAGSWIWRISRTSHCFKGTSEGSLKLRIHSLRLE